MKIKNNCVTFLFLLCVCIILFVKLTHEIDRNTNDAIYYMVSVNQNFTSNCENNNYVDVAGYLVLPENYDSNGEKTKLIMYAHGTGFFVDKEEGMPDFLIQDF